MMSWQAYRLVFQLKSPLHIGWRKTGNLMQTRYYVPGRIWWGAVTASLAQWMRDTSYVRIGELVKKYLRFGYFFPAENIDAPLYPNLSVANPSTGPFYGNRLEKDFEAQFISVQTSTAIAPEVNVAEEASLHEVEFIKPWLNLGKPVYLVGHLFVRQSEEIAIEKNDVKVHGFPLFSQVIDSLQIGGERRYGFGWLKLCRDKCRPVNDVFGYPLDQQGDCCCITVPENNPLLAHAAMDSSCLEGPVEPLVGREWAPRHGPGRQVVLIGLCYVPGSIVVSDTIFTIGEYGIWEQIRCEITKHRDRF